MPMHWQIDLDNGKSWYVGSWLIHERPAPSAAQVVIPVEQLDGMTDEEIGRYVRDAVPIALECNAAEIAYEAEREQREQRERLAARPKDKLDPSGYVYILKAETGHYKIGRTGNLDQRMRAFGVQLPFKFDVIYTFETADMFAEEDRLHRKFAAKRVNGEWFALSNADVAWIKRMTKYAEV